MNNLENWYLSKTKSSELIYDTYQATILQQLDIFINTFNNKTSLSTYIKSLFIRKSLHNSGVYLYGEVGRGKSMIINEMYNLIKDQKKIRLHFHEFMADINQNLNKIKHKDSPLKIIAHDLAKKYHIIFLDEFHVSDIATAMILKNLLTNLFDKSITLITSSNYPPNDLYNNGLMRERFLPAIDLINNSLKVLSLDSPRDYRGLHNSYNQMFIINNINSHKELDKIFRKIAGNSQIIVNNTEFIQSRHIPYVAKSLHIIWFEFAIICGNGRSQLDYIEICQKFDYVIIENISVIDQQDKDIARRLTWLIDIMYDMRKRLILSSSCDIDNIYPQGEFVLEFSRTISRLREMQTTQY